MLVATNVPPVTEETNRQRPQPSHPGSPDTARQADRVAVSASADTRPSSPTTSAPRSMASSGEGDGVLGSTGHKAPDPSPGRGVGNVPATGRRTDSSVSAHHLVDHGADGLGHIKSSGHHKGREQGMGHLARPTADPRHPDPPVLPSLSNLALIAGPPRRRNRTARTVRTGELNLPAERHVVVDGQRTRPYDGHRWKHRLGPPPPQCQLVRRGSLAFRDRSSSSMPGQGCPIASANTVTEGHPYMLRQSCRQQPWQVRH